MVTPNNDAIPLEETAQVLFSEDLSCWLAQVFYQGSTWQKRASLRREFTADPRLLQEVQRLNMPTINYTVDRIFNHPFDSFEPRPDDPHNGDEQAGFIDSNAFITILCGGNGSGKTYCGAQKTVKFLSETDAPKKDTPFWVIGNTYELVCQACWKQKLYEIIPEEWIDWSRITWYDQKRGWPLSVPLKKKRESDRGNWVIEFKSYEQGRALMQAVAIGGAWFTEQFPWEVFEETVRGAREFGFKGAIFAELTPVDPEKSVELQDAYEKWLEGEPEFKNWEFFLLNTDQALQAGHVDQDWYDVFYSMISDEMKDTRKKGIFASYEGQIYQQYTPRIHLISEDKYEKDENGCLILPHGMIHKRSIDWGASPEHPFVCLWGAKNGIGQWIIYDEYWNNSQKVTIRKHADNIKAMNPWPKDSIYHKQTYGDPSAPQLFTEMGAAGISVTGANNNVDPGIQTVKRLLDKHPGLGVPMLLIVKERCPKLARQMQTYRWEKSTGKGVNPKAARPQPLKNNDDAVDALRYLLHTDKVGKGRGAVTMKLDPPRRPAIRHQRIKE